MRIKLRKETSMTAKQWNEMHKEKRSEHDEQVEVVKYLARKKILYYAIPNGANKSRTARSIFKAEGLIAGVPDLCICEANKYYHGLYIEMKKRIKTLKSGKKSISRPETQPEQLKWLDNLNSNGYYAVVCYGADEAIKVIENYLEKA